MLSPSLLRLLGARWLCRGFVWSLERRWGARRRQPWLSFPMLPSPYGVLGVVVATSGCSILVVYLPTDVMTAVHVATLEEVSPGLEGRDKTWFSSGSSMAAVGMSACKSQWLESWRCGQCVLLLAAGGGGLVALAVTEFSHVVSNGFRYVGSLRVSRADTDCCFCRPFLGAVRGGTEGYSSPTSWSVRGLVWFCLWALDLVESSLLPLLLEFLLLCLVASFPTGSGCELQESVADVAGCAFYERGCCFPHAAVGFILVLRIQRCSQSSSLLVLVEVRFPQNCVVLVSGCCCAALWVEDCSGLVSASCCTTSGLRYAIVVLAGAFWWVSQNDALVVLVEFYLLRSGRLLALLVEVVFLFVFEFLDCGGGASCVSVVGWFASLLAPYVLSHMVVWVACPVFSCVALSAYMVGAVPCVCVLLRADVVVVFLKLLGFGAGVAYSTLLGLRFLACGFWQALSFLPLGHFVLACALWLYHYPCGVAALPCLGSPIGVFLWLHSRRVSLSDHEDDLENATKEGNAIGKTRPIWATRLQPHRDGDLRRDLSFQVLSRRIVRSHPGRAGAGRRVHRTWPNLPRPSSLGISTPLSSLGTDLVPLPLQGQMIPIPNLVNSSRT
ncbi:hypothetical protein Taro_027943 [Colocasia esculenta]|uniref:Uncharacterized protein n=1 Tax=Colocasia esculenta TaxID=4460 RepID=A0A843VF72_COLES|nr:hypothetical protein [Colocasia esculenta]